MGLIADAKGKYHSDPFFCKYNILKIQDLYKQQLQVQAWKFTKGKQSVSQVAMFNKVSDVHGHNTRSAKTGLFISTQDHRSVGYRIPREWQSLSGFKKKSKEEFLSNYKNFECVDQNCYICNKGLTTNESQRG